MTSTLRPYYRKHKALPIFLYLFTVTLVVTFQESNAVHSETSVTLERARASMLTKDSIQVIFSDVDGTLVHYPEDAEKHKGIPGNRILALPPSSTGMRGIISSRTLTQCQSLRQYGKKLVIISGMRTATLLKRLPYLPRSDAYCAEAGGRIFYPTPIDADYTGPVIKLEPCDGASPKDLTPFGIVEDLNWRARMERIEAAGVDGFVGMELANSDQDSIPVSERRGLLWDWAGALVSKGYVLDTKGYSTCFRVNRKHQTVVSEDDFEALSSDKILLSEGISTSVNLGCVDFYPSESGKKNCCAYLCKKFCSEEGNPDLSSHAICLCDDDNDLEMALACKHAYIPGVTSQSMAKVVEKNPDRMTVTGEAGTRVEGTFATEAALELVLRNIA
mmetsp:Transcript_7856/g.11322  ORF Transcript_7856/g.11322 Transcript_7856/m.11322 type:complete len:389 (-) Transcript_7856:103-1269(-)